MTVFDNIAIPKVIYETESEFNGKIQVVEIGNVRKLSVGNIVQSVSHDSKSAQNMVWGGMVELVQKVAPEARRILVLGLGGGAMQHIFSEKMPGIGIVSVEIDPAIVQVAEKYFDVGEIPNHKIITADACKFIVEPEKYDLEQEMFDVVIVDIYCGDKYPDLGKSGNFVARVKEMAAGGGIVIFNRIYIHSHQEDVNNFIEFLEDFFPEVETEIVPGRTNTDNVLIWARV